MTVKVDGHLGNVGWYVDTLSLEWGGLSLQHTRRCFGVVVANDWMLARTAAFGY
jgi:hypothetical protein